MAGVATFRNGAGGIVKKEMEARGWSQSDLAEITGVSIKTINQIINNRQIMTPDNAILLGKAFNTDPVFWMNLDATFQIENKKETRDEKGKIAEKKAALQKIMPFAEIKKKGWFCTAMSTLDEIETGCLDLFGTTQIPEEINGNDLKACARRTRKDNQYTERNCNAWYMFAKYFAENIKVKNYSPDDFKKIVENISSYTRRPEGVKQFIRDINDVGVGFFMLDHLEKTYLDGASFISNGHPFITYTGRYDRIDNFWFVMAHESAHILNDYEYMGKGPFLDDLDMETEQTDVRERRADKDANCYLKHDKVKEFGNAYGNYLSVDRLTMLSEYCGVSIPVALGMLQHDNIVDWRKFSKFREPVRDKIPDVYKKG